MTKNIALHASETRIQKYSKLTILRNLFQLLYQIICSILTIPYSQVTALYTDEKKNYNVFFHATGVKSFNLLLRIQIIINKLYRYYNSMR